MKTKILSLGFLLGLIVIFGLSMGATTYAATYYVDYDSGSDTAAGTSRTTAEQHASGDPNAGSNPRAVTLGAGDQMLFRGGVRYQGNIFITNSGTGRMPLRYTGNGWAARMP